VGPRAARIFTANVQSSKSGPASAAAHRPRSMGGRHRPACCRVEPSPRPRRARIAGQLADITERLDQAVRTARRAGVSWRCIGQAAGISAGEATQLGGGWATPSRTSAPRRRGVAAASGCWAYPIVGGRCAGGVGAHPEGSLAMARTLPTHLWPLLESLCGVASTMEWHVGTELSRPS
jgi:hypothetical protein